MGFVDTVTVIAKRVLGTTNDAELRKIWPTVHKVRALEPELQRLDDRVLRERSTALRKRVREDGASLDIVLIEALALAREAADRRLGMWNALDERKGFPASAWGDALAEVTALREAIEANSRLPEDQRKAMWDFDATAAVYAAIRKHSPDSVPPFRMRAHDVQVLGAIVLHQGRIAEMRTGEGKTLVASLTAYLNSLSGKGVHIVTVNDYLASRDAAWNAPTLRFLGCTIGAIQSQMSPWIRKGIYDSDVTYGTNNEFGFDYLRDNLAKSKDEQVQTRRTFAIVDEVDSVLVDEARTPLIISGPATGRQKFYEQARDVVAKLENGPHYEVDIKDRHVTLTEAGMDAAAKGFGVENMYSAEAMHLPHFLDNALKAKELYLRDREYLVVGDQVKIVDEHTGRIMEGRRWSDGLHQAIECKENVSIQEENQTYATITLQNFFRLYDKLAGMTGTAMTEAAEFHAIYKLDVVAVPPNRTVIRNDLPDLIYGTEKEKFDAIVREVEELHAIGQPILVGTVAVETSERLSEAFTRKGIPHNVLNAKQHAREAEIVLHAGQFGAVTIATNMAGRGTDIVLGRIDAKAAFKHWKDRGFIPSRLSPDSKDIELEEACLDLWTKRTFSEPGDEKELAKAQALVGEAKLKAINRRRAMMGWHPLPLPSIFKNGVDVRQIGGLRILGTERHDARRIDNQLRGRSGRQGDPGSSRFYLSLEDPLMKRFAGPMMSGLMRRMGLKDGVPIESPMVSRAVEKAQKRVEEYYFGFRKNLLEYDQVMNQQRTIIYKQRQAIIEGQGLEESLRKYYRDSLDDLVQKAAADGTRGPELAKHIADSFGAEIGLPAPTPDEIPVKDGGDACRDVLMKVVEANLATRKTEFGEMFPKIAQFVLLEAIDHRWKDHIDAMDHLRHSIGLEAYAQKDPRLRYKEEGYRRFALVNELIRGDVARLYFRVQIRQEEPPPSPAAALAAGGFAQAGGNAPEAPRAGAHDPCPCGSGRKYKNCHGR